MYLKLKSVIKVMITNDNKKGAKKSQKFCCEKCDYSTSKIGNWNRHVSTLKHKMITNDNKKEPKRAATYSCDGCGRIYKFPSGLSRHKSKCLAKKQYEEVVKNISPSINEELLAVLKELVKANQEPKVVNTTNNTQNISINMFLNNHCKDAMNLKDFLNTLKLSINDLFKTQELGFVGGISNILIKNLSDLPSIRRPIHCSDTKRMLFYVKEEDGWNKDEGNKVEKAIEDVTLKQIKTLHEWECDNPNYLENPKLLGEWNNLVHNIMGGSSNEERLKNKKLIKKQVGETTLIKDAIANLK
jgi:hypothetical protein|tara:strand:- start:398 stop:1297 length:900 start_codon:yes stop_codon:yes gene_type:complete